MKTRLLSTLVLALGLLIGVALLPIQQAEPAAAQSVVSETVVTLAAGGTSYTQTTNTSSESTQNYGLAQIQAHVVLTGSGVMTVTPYFSSEPGTCANARYWFPAKAYTTHVLTPGTISQHVETLSFTTISNDGGRTIPVQGRCMRVQLVSTLGRFTPTIYVRLVNQ